MLFKIKDGRLGAVFGFEADGGVVVIEFEWLEGQLINLIF